MQIGILKHPEQKGFNDMTRVEKRGFLANDLIDRMIRIEQRVRASMGEGSLSYNQTNYFKELHPEERARFVNFLNKKEKRKKWKFLPFLVIAGIGIFSGSRITGNVIGDSGSVSIIDWLLLGFFVISVIVYSLHVISERKRFERLDRHFKVLDRIVYKRKFRKN